MAMWRKICTSLYLLMRYDFSKCYKVSSIQEIENVATVGSNIIYIYIYIYIYVVCVCVYIYIYIYTYKHSIKF